MPTYTHTARKEKLRHCGNCRYIFWWNDTHKCRLAEARPIGVFDSILVPSGAPKVKVEYTCKYCKKKKIYERFNTRNYPCVKSICFDCKKITAEERRQKRLLERQKRICDTF